MWALWALPALLRSGLCPPAVWVVLHQLTSQNFTCLMGSYEAKKLPANNPHSDLSILKSAASSPVQHHNLPQTHLMPPQLWFFCLSGLAASTAAPLLQHQGSSAEPRSPELAPSLLKPQECFNLSQKQFLSSALGNPWEPQAMACCCHPHHHSAGPSFPFCHSPAHFFTRNYFQILANPSSSTRFCFHTASLVIHPQSSFFSLQASCCPHHLLMLATTTTTPFPNQPFPGIYTHDSATGEAAWCLCNKCYTPLCRARLAEIKQLHFFLL